MAAGGTITGPVVNALEIVVGRQIVGRICVEKAVRLQHEACIFDRHHREVFGLADMGMAKAVPHYDVGIIDVAISVSHNAEVHHRRHGRWDNRRSHTSRLDRTE